VIIVQDILPVHVVATTRWNILIHTLCQGNWVKTSDTVEITTPEKSQVSLSNSATYMTHLQGNPKRTGWSFLEVTATRSLY